MNQDSPSPKALHRCINKQPVHRFVYGIQEFIHLNSKFF